MSKRVLLIWACFLTAFILTIATGAGAQGNVERGKSCTGPTTFAASNRRRSVFGSLNVATSPDERDPAADFGADLAADFDPDVDAGADFLRALRRSATLLPPRAGGCRILGQA